MSAGGDQYQRIWLAAAAIGVIAVGLGSRSELLPLPAFVAKYAGDTLWAVLVFLLLAIAMPRRPTLSLAATALAIAFAVELLQLYQAAWINGIRDTLPGRLVLGQGFLFSDLICYTVGIGLAAMMYEAITGRSARDLMAIAGAGVCVFVVIAVLACNLGDGRELFGFVDRIPGRDKTGHFVLMAALAFFVVLMIVPRLKSSPLRSGVVVLAVLGVVVSLEEFSQRFLSARSFSMADLYSSLAGVAAGGVLAIALLVTSKRRPG